MKSSVFVVATVGVLGRKEIPAMPSCPNWPEHHCRSSASKNPCGTWCAETKQCIPTNGHCPMDEYKAARTDCHLITDPALCAVYTGQDVQPCQGYCLRVVNNSDGTTSRNWDDGLCLNLMEKCPADVRELVTKIVDVPCSVRHSCHDCYLNTWGSDVADEPDCVWADSKCRERLESDDAASFNIGLCEPVD